VAPPAAETGITEIMKDKLAEALGKKIEF